MEWWFFSILLLKYCVFSVVCLQKKVRLPKELTFKDMYNNQDAFDDDDEDDSDWEPVQKHIEILKWFCTNCTMVNLDDVVHCDVCLFILFLILLIIPTPPFLVHFVL